MMKRFAVFGNPVLHSKSPQIWNHAFERLGIDAQYIRINPGTADNAITALRELPLDGCNVTTPFKTELLKYLDELDYSVKQLEAVNTIKHEQGGLAGYNTDWYGVLDSLKADGVKPEGKKAVVLGAGGAARAAVYGLLHAHARDVVILNRTVEKAVKAAERLGGRAASLENARQELQTAEILISCVPAKERIIAKECLHPGLAVFDANYASESILLQDAEERGCQIISGLHWLVYQAVPAFQIFCGADATPYMKASIQSPAKTIKPAIAIIGFMGAGKSTISRQLSDLSGKPWLETDMLIEQRAGKSIPQIFEQDGEGRFRELERAVFEQIDFDAGAVISCGGGAIKDEAIRKLLSTRATVIWLWSSLDATIARIRKGTRPLLNVENIEQTAKTLFAERIHLYAACADMMYINERIGTFAAARQIYDEIYRPDTH